MPVEEHIVFDFKEQFVSLETTLIRAVPRGLQPRCSTFSPRILKYHRQPIGTLGTLLPRYPRQSNTQGTLDIQGFSGMARGRGVLGKTGTV